MNWASSFLLLRDVDSGACKSREIRMSPCWFNHRQFSLSLQPHLSLIYIFCGTDKQNWTLVKVTVVTVEKLFPSYWRYKNCTPCLPEEFYLGKATGNKFQSELWCKGGWNAKSLVKRGHRASCCHQPRLLWQRNRSQKNIRNSVFLFGFFFFCFHWQRLSEHGSKHFNRK